MIYPITPVPKPRMTQRDKWMQRPCVMRYRAYCDELRAHKITLPSDVAVIFYLPMPKSWSKKKKEEMLGMPHRQVPDLDNLFKALADGLCADDSFIWSIEAQKRWGYEGAIDLE